jgi:hypothetical protein
MKEGNPLSSGQNLSLNTGEFEVNNLPEPPFTLMAYHNQKATLSVEINNFSPLSLNMSEGATIQVQLLGSDVVGRRISMVTEEKKPITMMWGFFGRDEKLSSSTGEITLKHVNSGRYIIKVADKGNSDDDIFSEPFEAIDGSSHQVLIQGL